VGVVPRGYRAAMRLPLLPLVAANDASSAATTGRRIAQ